MRAAHGCKAGVALWLVSSCFGAAAVRAQALDLGLFSAPSGPAATFTIPEPMPARHGSFQFGLSGDFATALMDRSLDCTASSPADAACAPPAEAASANVLQQGRGAISAEVALFDALSIGVFVPVAVARVERDWSDAHTHSGMGDVGLAIAGSLLARSGTSVGWRLAGTLPTANTQTFAGEPTVTLQPSIVLSQAVGRFTLVGQLGYHLRERRVVFGVEQDDELVLKLGARCTLTSGTALIAEWSMKAGVGGRHFGRGELPAELDVGVRLGRLAVGELDLGVGTGAILPNRGVGSPALRVFLALRRSFETARCTSGPEDRDGFQDSDGCADPDNDRDGILDVNDTCPNDREDLDGHADADGCPDPDNDADGRVDTQDLCPDHSEDMDGFQDYDGCPEPDNDADGVADGSDRCRLDPEDRDAFEDEDGCPEPGPGRPTVTLAGSRLLMSERIYFEDESDTLRSTSAPTLDTLASTFKQLPGRPRLRVEGHTDDSGNPQYNLDLSYRRARAVVEYLKRQGVDLDRLEYVGRGSADPLGPNNSPEGRALNRRVEFVLLDR